MVAAIHFAELLAIQQNGNLRPLARRAAAECVRPFQ